MSVVLPIRRRFFFVGLVAIFAGPVLSETTLQGEQDGYLKNGEYLVTASITVKRGKMLSFAPGCIVRFKKYAELTVEGSIKCEGTAGLPIIFTSENDQSSNSTWTEAPKPFDWNGILVTDSLASLEFSYVRVTYSTFGLDVKSVSSPVKLTEVVFKENGKENLTVNGKAFNVKDNEPFTFSQSQWESVTPLPPATPLVDPTRMENNQSQTKRSSADSSAPTEFPTRTVLRIGFGTLAVGAFAIGVYNNSKVVKYQEKYEYPNSTTKDDADANAKKRDDAKSSRNGCYIISLIGALGFSVTFLF